MSDHQKADEQVEHWKLLFFKAYETIEAWHRIVQWYCAATGGQDIPERLRPDLFLGKFTGIVNNESQEPSGIQWQSEEFAAVVEDAMRDLDGRTATDRWLGDLCRPDSGEAASTRGRANEALALLDRLRARLAAND